MVKERRYLKWLSNDCYMLRWHGGTMTGILDRNWDDADFDSWSFITLWHSGARVHNTSQWKSGKFDSRSLKNPWTDHHLNPHGWLYRGPLHICKISSQYDYPLCPQICENAHQATLLVFFGSSVSLQPRPALIFTISTSNDVVSCKDVPFEGSKNKILHLHQKNANFWPIFDRT